MTDILNTGKSALFAFQRALATTSHNIANVNTEGYARQRIHFAGVAGNSSVDHSTGAGVEVVDISRMQDRFATTRVNSTTSAYEEQKAYLHMAERIDNLVASNGSSVAPAINDFFNAIQDANVDASSKASREVVLDRADQLINRFQSLQGHFDDIQTEVNQRTQAAADAVDALAQSIADVNAQVVSTSASASSDAANTLMDQRDQYIEELSEYLDVNTVIQADGALNVFMNSGHALVVNGIATRVSTDFHDTYPNRLQIMAGREGSSQNISPRISGGELGGLDAFATQTLRPAMAELGRLALSMADSLNKQHAKGIDLNGQTGSDLFGVADPSVYASSKNAGSGVLSATISDPEALKATDYLITYDGTDYIATRESDGTSTTGSLPWNLDGLSLAISGTPTAGDTFVVSATGRAAASITKVMTNSDDLALSSRLTSSSDISNLGDSNIGRVSVIDNTNAALTTPIDIVFTSDSNYDIVNPATGTTITAGVNYVSGNTVALNGWEVSISGMAMAGDTHHVEPNVAGKGNNSNGLALSEMHSAMMLDNGTQTYSGSYGAMVARVGAQTNSASNRADALESLRDAAVDRQQSIQAVSLDEEAIDLTRYQQAYQASAQIISIADEMFETILGAVR